MDIEKARERIRASYKRIEDEKKARQIRIIPLSKVKPSLPTRSDVTCQAMCLTGKKCTFKATSPCGKFCRKHIIEDGQSCNFINDGLSRAKPTCA